MLSRRIDRGYGPDANRTPVRQMRARRCIRPNPTRKAKRCCGKARDDRRNVIGRFFGGIQRLRRAAVRYEKKAEEILGLV